MKVIEPSVEIIDEINGEKILKKIEQCGRTCYKSEDRIAEGTARKFIAGIIKRGHESVLEHQSITVKFICDRAIMTEIVRHRLASYSCESTRYCNYGGEITVIEPIGLTTAAYFHWLTACNDAEKLYKDMLDDGCPPEFARDVLPQSTKCELVMTANLREWRHFFKMRCSKAAHPQMRQVANMLLTQFKEKIPVIFDDIEAE